MNARDIKEEAKAWAEKNIAGFATKDHAVKFKLRQRVEELNETLARHQNMMNKMKKDGVPKEEAEPLIKGFFKLKDLRNRLIAEL